MRRFFVFSSTLLLGFVVSPPASAQTEAPNGTVPPGTESSAPPPSVPEGEPTNPPAKESSPAPVDAVSEDPETPSKATASEATPTRQDPTEGVSAAPEAGPEKQATGAPSDMSGKTKPPYDGPATLLDDDGEKMHIGGYGGLSVHGTSIHRTGGLLLGGEGALLLDHRLALGLAGYGLTSEVRGPDFADGEESILGFGYGGAILRYHLVSERSPVTASLGTLIGAGGLTLIKKAVSEDFEYEYDYEEDTAASAFFVAEPSVQVNLHLTKWMRFGVSGGYRFVRGPSLRGISAGELEGITAGGHAQFGWF